jgi:hypothetical protein
MTEKTHLDQLLDVVVYAPFGLLANARELMPKLAEQGREQLDLQMRLCRMLGQFAVAKGRQEAGKVLHRIQEAAQDSTAPEATDGRGEAPGGARPTDATASPSIVDEEVIAVRHADDDPTTAASVGADELAIPEYDALAASQVVQRLDGLTPDELEAVRRYEQAHRARRTVLGKVAQLQAR